MKQITLDGNAAEMTTAHTPFGWRTEIRFIESGWKRGGSVLGRGETAAESVADFMRRAKDDGHTVTIEVEKAEKELFALFIDNSFHCCYSAENYSSAFKQVMNDFSGIKSFGLKLVTPALAKEYNI